MKTDTALFLKALGRLPEIAKLFEPATPEFLAWLTHHKIPEEIVEHYSKYSLTGTAKQRLALPAFGGKATR